MPGFSATGKTEYCCLKDLWNKKIQYFGSLEMVYVEKSRDKKRRKTWRASREERMRGCKGVGKEYLPLSLSQEVFWEAIL